MPFPVTPRYFLNFRNSDTGLTPSFLSFKNATTFANIAGPVITESPAGGGTYYFDWTWTTKSDADIVFEVDGGASIPTEEVRYIKGALSPRDRFLDEPISQVVADVWDEAMVGHQTAGTAGEAVTHARLANERQTVAGFNIISNDASPSLLVSQGSAGAPGVLVFGGGDAVQLVADDSVLGTGVGLNITSPGGRGVNVASALHGIASISATEAGAHLEGASGLEVTGNTGSGAVLMGATNGLQARGTRGVDMWGTVDEGLRVRTDGGGAVPALEVRSLAGLGISVDSFADGIAVTSSLGRGVQITGDSAAVSLRGITKPGLEIYSDTAGQSGVLVRAGGSTATSALGAAVDLLNDNVGGGVGLHINSNAEGIQVTSSAGNAVELDGFRHSISGNASTEEGVSIVSNAVNMDAVKLVAAGGGTAVSLNAATTATDITDSVRGAGWLATDNLHEIKVAVDAINVETDPAAIANAVWNELITGHQTANSMGRFLNDVFRLLKNKSIINPTTKQLEVYDDAGAALIFTFDLKDDLGVASATKIFQRLPL